MKYIIYCRKSIESEDRQILSLDAQERELLDIAQKHNLKVTRVLRESMSAKSSGRPLFEQMMKLIDTGKVDAILCWKLDRLARNFADGGLIIDQLQRSKIKEIRTYEGIHLPADNVLPITVQLGMANQYVRDLSVNVKRGNKEKLLRGGWPNKAPLGYLNDKANKTIFPDPILSKFIPRLFDLYITGSYGFQPLSDLLYSEGFRSRSGKKILKGHIQKILSCIFYTGLMEKDGKQYQGSHQPLISRSTFQLAQDVMAKRNHPRPKHLFFPLRGLLSCAVCGCSLTATLKKGHHYYYCTNGKRNCLQHKKYTRELHLYNIVTELLGGLAFSERKIEIMYQAAKAQIEAGSEYFTKATQELENKCKALEAKESRLLDAFLADQVPKELYDRKLTELRNEGITLLSQLKELGAKKPSSTLELTKNTFLQANNMKKEFLKADDAKKRKIAETVLLNLSMKDKKPIEIQFKNPFQLMYNTPKNMSFEKLLPDLESNQD